MKTKKMSLESFVTTQFELLELEREAELLESESQSSSLSDKELERRGIGLSKLILSGTSVGLYGKSLVHLEGKEFPAHRLGPGDIVGLSSSKAAPESAREKIASSGVVTKMGTASLTLAFQESLENLDLEADRPYRIIKLANDITYRRLKRYPCQPNLPKTGKCLENAYLAKTGKCLENARNRALSRHYFYFRVAIMTLSRHSPGQ